MSSAFLFEMKTKNEYINIMVIRENHNQGEKNLMKLKLLSLLAAVFLIGGCHTATNQETPKEEPEVVEPAEEQKEEVPDVPDTPSEPEDPENPVEPSEPVDPEPQTPTDPVEPEEPVKVIQVISFASTSGNGEHSDDSLTAMMAGDLVESVTGVNKVYKSTGSGGAHPNEDGILKLATAKANGTMTINLKKAVKSISIKNHDFYAKSDQYPTNSNKLIINGVEKLAAYNENGDGEDILWEFEEAVSVISIETTRVYIWEMTISE